MARETDDDGPEGRSQAMLATAKDLTPLSIDALTTYIQALEAEIARVQGEIAAKRQHRLGAEGLFKR